MLLVSLHDGINETKKIVALSCYTWRSFDNEKETFLKILDQNNDFITVKISDYVMIHIDALIATGIYENEK